MIGETEGDLTLAQAIALPASEVETDVGGRGWVRLGEAELLQPLSEFRMARFRRARPKRSRVQEMATKGPFPAGGMVSDMYEHAIRAVAAFLRDRAHTDDVCREPDHWAMRIEAHFLEPR